MRLAARETALRGLSWILGIFLWLMRKASGLELCFPKQEFMLEFLFYLVCVRACVCVCLSVYDVCVETLQKSVISYFFGREALISEAVHYRLAVLQASRPLSYVCLSSWECLLIPCWLRASGLQLWGVKGHQGKMDVLETNTSYFAVLPKVSLAACLLQAFSLMTHFFSFWLCWQHDLWVHVWIQPKLYIYFLFLYASR